jgi:hypothetical protein
MITSALVAAGCSSSNTTKSSAVNDLCSTDGIAKLVPQLRDANGKFTIPNPNSDLASFVAAQRALSNVISVALTQAESKVDIESVANSIKDPVTFPQAWRSAEVGVGTDGNKIVYPEATNNDNAFTSFGGKSFINGITAVAGSKGNFFQVNRGDGTIPALVSPVPTLLPCVNRLILAQDSSAGTWMPPSYVLANSNGEAFLIVDLCVDLAQPKSLSGTEVLTPSAEIFIAMQWADTEELAQFRTDDVAHNHRS